MSKIFNVGIVSAPPSSIEGLGERIELLLASYAKQHPAETFELTVLITEEES